MHAQVELRDLIVATDIGTYGPDDVVPDAHVLDMTLRIDPGLVMIAEDGMAGVYDYDPLIRDIDRIARDGHYHTQERVMTRIVGACTAYPEIEAVTLTLSKAPVLAGSGKLGVTLEVDAESFAKLRSSLSA
ncbi:MAG: dihydroneopterin aldolase [Pseudomonadota bacterium]